MSDSSMVKWGGVNVAAARQQAEEMSQGDGGEFMKLAVGKNVVRFLPPPQGKDTCFTIIHEHYIPVPGADAPMVTACPRMMAKQPCVVCQKVAELNATGNPADRDAGYRMRAQKRVYSAVVNRKQPELGVLILGYGKQIFDQLMAILEDQDGGGDFTDPTENGCDIVIERVGTSKEDTKYTVRCSRMNSALDDLSLIEAQPDIMAKVGRAREVDALEKVLVSIASSPRPSSPAMGSGRHARATPPRTAQTDTKGAASASDDD